jgi:hypothetical protein
MRAISIFRQPPFFSFPKSRAGQNFFGSSGPFGQAPETADNSHSSLPSESLTSCDIVVKKLLCNKLLLFAIAIF